MSSNAILAYGYDLGPEPAFRGPPGKMPAWWGDDDDFIEASERRLLAQVGFDIDDHDTPDFARRRHIAWRQVGVFVDTHCTDDHPHFLLSAAGYTAYRGLPRAVDTLYVPTGTEAQLAWAANILDLAIADAPRWILASYWGR